MSSLGAWKAIYIRSGQKQVVWGFGHDFRDCELWIVEVGSGRRVAKLAPDLRPREAEQVARIIRQSPVLTDTCQEAVRRLSKAQHPNAKALRELIHCALRGLEIPVTNDAPERLIDP